MTREWRMNLDQLEAALNETTPSAGKPQAHDDLRARVGVVSTQVGNGSGGNSRSLTPRPTDIAKAIPQDAINHPKHYTSHPSGIECIVVTEWMNFNLGNAVKYIWRNGDKGDTLQDLKKARWYIDREISRLEDLMR